MRSPGDSRDGDLITLEQFVDVSDTPELYIAYFYLLLLYLTSGLFLIHNIQNKS